MQSWRRQRSCVFSECQLLCGDALSLTCLNLTYIYLLLANFSYSWKWEKNIRPCWVDLNFNTSLFSRTYCILQMWRHFPCVSAGSCRRLWVTGVCWGTWLVNGSTRPSSFATRIAFMALISSGHQWNRLRGRWPYVSVLTFDCRLLTERRDLGVLKQQPGKELILLWSSSLFILSVYSKSVSKVRLN